MNIRETLEALVCFLRQGHQSGNTTAALHGVAHVGPAPGRDWERPRLVFSTEQDAHRMMSAHKVPCMSLSVPHRVRTARPGPVVFDTWTVEQLAEKALQRIQFLEARLEKAEVERDLFKQEMIALAVAQFNGGSVAGPSPDMVAVPRGEWQLVNACLSTRRAIDRCEKVEQDVRLHQRSARLEAQLDTLRSREPNTTTNETSKPC